MFEVMIRPGFNLTAAPSGPFYCEDWRCPARNECERHFGRSYAYAAMISWTDGKDKTPFFTPDRPPFAAQCQHFRRDRPRDWLRGNCEPPLQHGEQRVWCCTGCEMPECPRPTNVVQLFPARGAA